MTNIITDDLNSHSVNGGYYKINEDVDRVEEQSKAAGLSQNFDGK